MQLTHSPHTQHSGLCLDWTGATHPPAHGNQLPQTLSSPRPRCVIHKHCQCVVAQGSVCGAAVVRAGCMAAASSSALALAAPPKSLEEWVLAQCKALVGVQYSRVERLTGGFVNAVCRVSEPEMTSPPAAPSVVVKVTPPFVATQPKQFLSQSRQLHEQVALGMFHGALPTVSTHPKAWLLAGALSTAFDGLHVIVPKPLGVLLSVPLPKNAVAMFSGAAGISQEPARDEPHAEGVAHVLAMEDMTPCLGLDAILRRIAIARGSLLAEAATSATPFPADAASTEGGAILPKADELNLVGDNLGSAIASLHYRSCLAMEAEMGATISLPSPTSPAPLVNMDVQAARKAVQYDRVAAALRELAAAAGGDEDSLALADACAAEMERLGEDLLIMPGCCFIMGDLWPASVLLRRLQPLSETDAAAFATSLPSTAKSAIGGSGWELSLIDWEFSHWGQPGQDLGHFLAHLFMWAHASCTTASLERDSGLCGCLCQTEAASLAKSFLGAWANEVRRLHTEVPAGCAEQFLSTTNLRVTLVHAAAEVLARCIGGFVEGFVYSSLESSAPAVREAVVLAISLWALASNLGCCKDRAASVPTGVDFLGQRLFATELGDFLAIGCVARLDQ